MAKAKYVINTMGNCRLCKEPDAKDDTIACDECMSWFHFCCVGITEKPGKDDKWSCVKCSEHAALAQKVEELSQALSKSAIGNPVLETKPSTSMGNTSKTFTTTSIPVTTAIHDSMMIHLKRQALLQLPTFSGAAKDWPKFKQIYDQTTREGMFSNLENLTRLHSVLQGAAARSVQQLMMDPANIPRIIARLEENFGKPEIIYRELVFYIMKIKKDANNSVIEISEALENLVNNMRALNKPNYLQDHRLIDDIVEKLPHGLQLQWADVLIGNANAAQPSLVDLSDWLIIKSKCYRVLKSVTHNYDRKLPINFHETSHGKCILCKNPHKLYQCNNYKQLKVEDKIQLVRSNDLCFNCLLSGHRSMQCRNTRRCNVNGCTRKHHASLHESKPMKQSNTLGNSEKRTKQQPITQAPKKIEQKSTDIVENINHHQQFKRKILYQIIPVELSSGSRSMKTFAFLDQGSSSTLIDQEVANYLELQGRTEIITLNWTQNISKDVESKYVTLKIKGITNHQFTLKGVQTIENLQLPTQSVNPLIIKEQCLQFKDINIEGYENAKPTILIGADNAHLLLPLEWKGHGPYAIKTKLGWTLLGKVTASANEKIYSMVIDSYKIEKMLNDYFSIEDHGVQSEALNNLPKSRAEKRAADIIENTLKYKDGRYEIGLLWKQDTICFPDSFHYALKRLSTMEKGLLTNPELKTWAINTFKDYERKGYIRKLTQAELAEPNRPTFYLPHFIVINRNKPKPKPRLVFDAAAVVKGTSFNSTLLSGPDATTPLFGVLLRFREGQYAVSGDIAEMFHQIKIIEKDQHAQRILWRDCNSEKEPEVFVMQVMTFGSTCSPSCAQAVKNFNASKFTEKYPKAAIAVVKQHYVDDYLDSFDTEEEASQITNQVIDIHDTAGFFIRNFISNSRSITETLPKDRQEQKSMKLFSQKESKFEKVLGVYWNTNNDAIGYTINMNKLSIEVLRQENLPRKREVLAFVASIYDPLGLIANITIHGKILVQMMHKETIDWDQRMSEHMEQYWTHWLDLIKQAENLSIPRHVSTPGASDIELHTFVDASERAYAACIYVRSKNKDQAISKLLCAKSKVAPTRTKSIPRLELEGALLGARLLKQVREDLRLVPSKVVLWTDSQNVLSWIASDQWKYKQIVAVRVGEILTTTSVDQWRWVPSKSNPADEATKEVTRKSIWFDGPDFLRLPEEHWPATKKITETTEELKHVGVHAETIQQPFEERYSSWKRLIHHMCILKKFVEWLRNDNIKREITMEDRTYVERIIFK